jgi:hypothetical protein
MSPANTPLNIASRAARGVEIKADRYSNGETAPSLWITNTTNTNTTGPYVWA